MALQNTQPRLEFVCALALAPASPCVHSPGDTRRRGAGVPLTVARQMLPSTQYIVGCFARDAVAAAAAAADGASFIVLEPPPPSDDQDPLPLQPGMVAEVSQQARSGLNIPLLVSGHAVADGETEQWLQNGIDGICGNGRLLRDLAAEAPAEQRSEDDSGESAQLSIGAAARLLVRGLAGGGWSASAAAATAANDTGAAQQHGGGEAATATAGGGLLTELLQGGSPVDRLLEREKALMPEIISFLEEATPEMDETKLLRDALAGAFSAAVDCQLSTALVGRSQGTHCEAAKPCRGASCRVCRRRDAGCANAATQRPDCQTCGTGSSGVHCSG